MRHALQEWSNEEHYAATRQTLLDMAVKLLEIPASVIDKGISTELTEGNLTAEIIDQYETIFLTPLFRAEMGCENHLLCLNQGMIPWGTIDAQKAIP